MKFISACHIAFLAQLPLACTISVGSGSQSNRERLVSIVRRSSNRDRPLSIVRRSSDDSTATASDAGNKDASFLDVKARSFEILANSRPFGQNCGRYIGKVLHTLMYAFAKKHQNHAYISEFEAKLWQGLEDNENGVEVLSNTMRVLGNYSLADGIRAGEVWTIED
eukprot:CAMPEP_0169404412 /NCGR_PEP_ID=MMETSP1017-20121227/56340_1 /TAXON_ID=342587 /ORGANISM="Karlodinium micrum, Strain CCMP2283" /LENGTH=165 /DNA_ID=CAMNT_0009510821 /DNA_START=1 /DNA_END=495 /DNA_ORIENTATION=-